MSINRLHSLLSIYSETSTLEELSTSNLFTCLIHAIPGYFSIVNMDSKYLLINQSGAEWLGFTSSEEAVGLTYSEIRTPIAEDAEFFVQQDLETQKRGRTRGLGHLRYADGWKLIMGQKFMLMDKQTHKQIGLVCQADDFTHSNVIDFSRFLGEGRNHFYGKSTSQFFYSIEDTYPDSTLSQRQSECLFYILRCKRTKEIAKILQISPRTVETYINEIKLKLGCNTIPQIMERAVSQGYLSVMLESLMTTICSGR